MKYVYGLNISGESIIEYFFKKNIYFYAWDDDEKIRKEIQDKYNRY